jgi:GH24 family phage-related lysozyme (muramidase)
MKTSPIGVALIKKFEGLRTTSYKDVGGVWTVGYGSTGPEIGPDLVITEKRASELLEQDIRTAEKGVLDALKVPVNQNEFDALVSFAFNVGVNAFKSSTLCKLLNDGATESTVAAEFSRWINVEGKPNEGLKKRRQAEKQLFLSKSRNVALAHSIVAQRDTWLKREPKQSSSLTAEQKLFVPAGAAHIWDEITIVPSEVDYKVYLTAQPDKPWWFYPDHWRIINDPKIQENDSENSAPVKDIVLDVPYFSQRDNKQDPMRTCFSSSCAMMLKYLRPNSIRTDDDYIKIVFKYGDTTEAYAQISALEDFGVESKFLQTGSWAQLDAQLEKGVPVPIGILHKGPVQAATGGGHWICVIGKTADGKSYIVHDPFGELDLVSGKYINTNGKSLRYSKKNLGPRWLVESPNSGWFIRAQP